MLFLILKNNRNSLYCKTKCCITEGHKLKKYHSVSTCMCLVKSFSKLLVRSWERGEYFRTGLTAVGTMSERHLF